MYSFQSMCDSIIFIQRRVEATIYIYSSQLSSIAMNTEAKQNVVNRELKTRYMLWP
jgi:hypothetical protein